MTVSSVPLELLFQLRGQMANKKTKDAVRSCQTAEDVKPGKGVGSEGRQLEECDFL